jgi:hypothetical protein
VLLNLAGLHPSADGVRVRFSGGKPTVVNGSFPETKEIVAGYWILQVISMDEAVEWAKRVPVHVPAAYGGEGEVEIRQIFEPEEFVETRDRRSALLFLRRSRSPVETHSAAPRTGEPPSFCPVDASDQRFPDCEPSTSSLQSTVFLKRGRGRGCKSSNSSNRLLDPIGVTDGYPPGHKREDCEDDGDDGGQNPEQRGLDVEQFVHVARVDVVKQGRRTPVVVTTAVPCLGAGMIYDVALVSLPARRRFAVMQYRDYVRAHFETYGL